MFYPVSISEMHDENSWPHSLHCARLQQIEPMSELKHYSADDDAHLRIYIECLTFVRVSWVIPCGSSGAIEQIEQHQPDLVDHRLDLPSTVGRYSPCPTNDDSAYSRDSHRLSYMVFQSFCDRACPWVATCLAAVQDGGAGSQRLKR